MSSDSNYPPLVDPKLMSQATGDIYQVIKDFNPRLEDELALQVGEKVEVISDDSEYNDGWYMGRSLSSGKVGLYPKTFTRIVPKEDKSKPTLLRSRSRRLVSPASSSTPQTPNSPQVASFRDKNKSEVTTPISTTSFKTFSDLPPANNEPKRQSMFVNSTISDVDRALAELGIGSVSADVSKDEISDVSMTSVSPDYIETWSPEQVTQYFLSLGFDASSCQQFIIHKITGALLLEFELSFLKELDISSFGTRFEMFKEIEALKEFAGTSQMVATPKSVSSQAPSSQRSQSIQHSRPSFDPKSSTSSSSLLEPPEVVRSAGNVSSIDEDLETFTRPLANHQRKKSRSLDDIPEQGKQPMYGNPSGSSIYTKLSNASKSSQVPQLALPSLPPLQSPLQDQFLSPRRAPNPPPFPSPVQLHPERYSTQNTPTRSSFYEQQPQESEPQPSGKSHSRKPSYDINPQFQFNSSSSLSKPTTGNSRNPSMDFGHSRSSSRQNIKSHSFIDLPHMKTDNRPPSSVYLEPGINHSRRSSFAGHSRMASDASFMKAQKEGKTHHRRHSSVFSFMSSSKENNLQDQPLSGLGAANNNNMNQLKMQSSRPASVMFGNGDDHLDLFDTPAPENVTSSRFSFLRRGSEKRTNANIPTLDPKANRRSVSANDKLRIDTTNLDKEDSPLPSSAEGKRSVSETTRQKPLRSISTATTPTSGKKLSKKDTSAFMEGIKNVTPTQSIKNSECHGWMNKKGGLAVGTWKQRYFVLHGTRLSYFATLNDRKERGLIDITSHRVLPAKDDDKLVSLYAATTGNGKFCFKLVPPAPGSRKGLTFTQPKVHYFAVETKEEMRTWMSALIKATIDKDESVPVLSSCATPTVSLQKAQVLLAQARENAKRREMEAGGITTTTTESGNNSSLSPADSDSFDSSNPNFPNSPNTTVTTGDLHNHNNQQLHTPVTESSNGFSSPYDLANVVPKNKSSKSIVPSPIEEFKSKPYNAGTLRHPSTRVPSSQNVIGYANGKSSSGNLISGGRL
ncbi:hypothetical protein WICPIJ_000865 [Wickerhamomyces pijperi]|uniref:Protein BOI2 n=1 Tax=Wickerhamomyces pijperi TaxID=599730 RepID=A0A9P8QF09_WICPI|nr:hypothetical protein WICPIJ_000865 [Wickerhamomyces pijperi]